MKTTHTFIPRLNLLFIRLDLGFPQYPPVLLQLLKDIYPTLNTQLSC